MSYYEYSIYWLSLAHNTHVHVAIVLRIHLWSSILVVCTGYHSDCTPVRGLWRATLQISN